MRNSDTYYTSQGFASAIGVHRNTVIRWHKSGKLIPHHVTVTGHRFYSQAQVDEVLGGIEDEEEN